MFLKITTCTILPLFILFFSHEISSSQNNDPYYVLGYPGFKPHPPGLFCVFACVLGFLEFYEHHSTSGIEVNFANEGIYYDAQMGSNWWEYYFSPIRWGHRKYHPVKKITDPEAASFGYAFLFKPRIQGQALIKKYIQVHPRIQAKVNDFIQEKFTAPFMIGVHYRGTDKASEAPRVPYDKIYEEIDKIVQNVTGDFRIFVATDEQAFLDDILNIYPNHIVASHSHRSTDGKPIHYGNHINNFQKGEEAVIDCLLLSHCHCIIRTISYLSTVASFFNPDIPLITLNKLYSQKQLTPL